MPRNQEVIRQWKILHALDASRHGVTIAALASELNVTTRTIRRDLAALQEAGFPLYDERDEDGGAHWRLDDPPLKGLETGFTLAELCALYLSRNLLETVAGTPFQRDLTLAFSRLEKMLSPRMRQFLDRLPAVLTAKPGPQAHVGEATADIVARLLEATLHLRVTTMRYHSVSSDRTKDYSVHPYRLVFALSERSTCSPTYPSTAIFERSQSIGSGLCRSKSRPSRRPNPSGTTSSPTLWGSTRAQLFRWISTSTGRLPSTLPPGCGTLHRNCRRTQTGACDSR